HEPAGERRAHAVHRPPAPRRGREHPADRARHEGGHGHLRPRGRARPRREDCRGAAGGRAARPEGDRSLFRGREPGAGPGTGGRACSLIGLPAPASRPHCWSTAPDPCPRGAASVLKLDDVHTYYGHIAALKGVSLAVEAGEIVALIGANGAGKSTTLRTISGLQRPRSGTITFEGARIDGLPPHQIAARRIVQAPEGRRLFNRMTVAENLEMGAFVRRDRARLKDDMARVFALFPRLKERATQKAGTLSGGEQQMLAIGRALMAEPRLLLLDEPSMGLAPIVVEAIFETLVEINRQGVTILLVEQNAHMALAVANRGYVLETGRVILADSAARLRADEAVQRAYLGIESLRTAVEFLG